MQFLRFFPSHRTDAMIRPVLSLLGLGLSLALSGCRHSNVPVSSALPAAKPPAAKSPPASVKRTAAPQKLPPTKQLAKLRVNEAGVVPILEYHTFGESKTTMDRAPKLFRRDLERLWNEGYRPISMKEFLDNRISLPLGKSPVVLTFDDSRESQLRFLDDGTVDPECAVGIMMAFHKKHPAFALRGVFYVVPSYLFGAPSQSAKKLHLLRKLGFEIGNHTVSHPTLSKLSDSDVQKEFAGCLARTRKLEPNVPMETIALPKGVFPRNHALLASGCYEGQNYTHRAVLLGGYCPANAPVCTHYNPMKLPRVLAFGGHMGITFWLDDLKRHPESRYVSDGNPKMVTVPKAVVGKVDKRKLHGAKLRVY